MRNHPNPAHQREMIKWAQNVLAAPDRYAILDTETTGLESTAEVIQIAIIDPAGKKLFDSLIRPIDRKRIPTEATRIHGITMKMLEGAPIYSEIAPILIQIVEKRNIICYNAAFDGRLLNQTAEKTGAPKISGRWACAMLAYAKFRGVWNERRQGYLWHKLPEADHSTYGDCLATLKIIREMAGARPLRRWYEFWIHDK
jgi:DNA polymerase-3 subunit epsilon